MKCVTVHTVHWMTHFQPLVFRLCFQHYLANIRQFFGCLWGFVNLFFVIIRQFLEVSGPAFDCFWSFVAFFQCFGVVTEKLWLTDLVRYMKCATVRFAHWMTPIQALV